MMRERGKGSEQDDLLEVTHAKKSNGFWLSSFFPRCQTKKIARRFLRHILFDR
jgi:hypothetical protein